MPRKVICLVAALAVAGCGHTATSSAPAHPAPSGSTWLITPGGPPPAAPASVGSPPSASSPAAEPTAEPDGAPPGTRTCTELSVAIKAASLMQPGVVDRIVAASNTADAPVGDAAERLATAYAKATASKGTGQEPDAVAAVSAAAADMDGVCTESGLESAG